MKNSIAAFVLTSLMTLGTANAHAQDKWWPSKYGADDELGAFNLLTPELALKAAKLIKTGKSYRLGIETNSSTPAFPPRTFSVQVLLPNQYDGTAIGDNKFNYADDIISGWMGVGSQIDGLGHAATDGIYYNGKKAKDFIKADGLQMFGMENLPPIVTRGVMLDIAACMGKEILDEGTAFNSAEIMACEKSQGVSIEKGDVVLFNTGWMNMLDKDPERFGKGEPGLGIDGAKYLVEKDVVAVGGDSWGVEVIPTEDPKILYHVHQILLNYNGIYILENMDTRELAKDKAYEFMFVLGPARMTGAVQMIINPIAIR
ncbi:MAG: cyclase family protein [Gammaproteobacteria bacterium]